MTIRQIVAAVTIGLASVAAGAPASQAFDARIFWRAPITADTPDVDRSTSIAVSFQTASPGAMRVPRATHLTAGPTGFEGNTTPLTKAQAQQAFKAQGTYQHISQIQPTTTPGVNKASLMHDKTAVWITFNANTGQILSETPQ